MDISIQEEIRKGNIERVTYLLDENGLVRDTDWRDYHLLKSALSYGQEDIAKLLLQAGARVNKISHNLSVRETTPLHLATNRGSSEIIDILLNKGASLDAFNYNGESPLALAVFVGNYPIVDRILSAISTERNLRSRCGLTHLHIACMRNRVDILKRFLWNRVEINSQVNVESRYWPGYTALHFAAEFQCTETLELLVNCGADITVKNTHELTPLHLAFINQNEFIIDLILSKNSYIHENPTDSEGLSHFHIACTRRNPKIVDDFLKCGVNVDLKVSENAVKWPSYTPLRFAIQYQCVDIIELLLLHGAELSQDVFDHVNELSNVTVNNLIDTKIKLGEEYAFQRISEFSNLHVACINNDPSSVQGMLNFNLVDSNLPTWLGLTSLHFAVQGKHKDIVQLLIDSGADFTVKDDRGKTALHLAFEIEENDIVDLILAAHTNVKENPINNAGLSHFHIACTRNDLNLVKDFLENGVDINGRVSIGSAFFPGNTALHFACTSFEQEVVELLLKHGADVMARNDLGLTPLELVFKTCNIENSEREKFLRICDLLLSAHENNRNDDFITSKGLLRLHLACAENDADAVRLLANVQSINRPVNLPNWSGRTPLHFAACFNNEDVIELLLNLGADPLIEDDKGRSTLVFWLHRNTMLNMDTSYPYEGLFYYKGDVNTDAALLHLHLACHAGYPEVVEYLLKREVNVNSLFNSRYDYTRTPLQVVICNDEADEDIRSLIELLLKYGADVNKADFEMETPLHYAVKYTDDSELTELLLRNEAHPNLQNSNGQTPLHYATKHLRPAESIVMLMESGADMDIEDSSRNTFLTCFNADYILRAEFRGNENIFQIALSLIKHVKKLRYINFRVSEKNEQGCQLLLDKYNQGDLYYFIEAEFAGECKNELDYMSTFKLNSYTTLRDVIFKEAGNMALYTENVKFLQILDFEDFKDKFPIYGFILKLQLKKGLMRRPFLEPIETLIGALNSQSEIKLPDSCYEHVIQYLSNEELDRFIKVFIPSEEKKRNN